MDLDPNYIKENLHQIGIKDSKALLKEWIDNSNDIELRKSALRIYSSIDDGKSFKVPSVRSDLATEGKLGLIGMQERARLLGGTFSIESRLGKGTSIVAEIPI